MPSLHSDTGRGPYTHQTGVLWENSSRDGAIVIDPHAAAIRARYWALLLKAGSMGLTDEEAAGRLKLKKITTLIPRRHELKKQVVWSGRKRLGQSDVAVKVWIAARWAPVHTESQ